MRPGECSITQQTQGNRYSLLLEGELDMATAPDLQERVAKLCDDGAIEIVLDLSALSFIDSTGLSTILSTHKVCEETLCNLWLIPGPERIQRVFDLAGVTRMLPFRDVSERADASIPGE